MIQIIRGRGEAINFVVLLDRRQDHVPKHVKFGWPHNGKCITLIGMEILKI
jgi:hypothetical protein